MDITPHGIRIKRQDFRVRFRGFDQEEVASYLASIAEGHETLIEENRLLAERAERSEELAKILQDREDAVVRALTMAEEMREEAREQAQREGALIMKRAHSEAEDLRIHANAALAAAKEELRRLHARRAQLIASFRAFLQHEISEMNSMDTTLRERAEDAGFQDIFPLAEMEVSIPVPQAPLDEEEDPEPPLDMV